MKYVMFKGEDHYVPIIFPEILVHADVSGWMLAGLGIRSTRRGSLLREKRFARGGE